MKEQIRGVSIIPFGLLSCKIGQQEVGIQEVAEQGFRFRTAEPFWIEAGETENHTTAIQVCFYDLEQQEYQKIILKQYKICAGSEKDFWHEYLVWVCQEDYQQAVRKLFRQYTRYIHLKTECEDWELAAQLTRYPADKEEEFADCFKQQKEQWLQGFDPATFAGLTELAVEVDHPQKYRAYLKGCLKETEKADRLYIGNQFCHLLFPDEETLFAIMEKCRQNRTAVTVVFSYIREYMLKDTQRILERISNWCTINGTKVEVVVNDWGMAALVKRFMDRDGEKKLIPCLGILLNKRKKDPRLVYQKGKKELLKKNSLNCEEYREYLYHTFGIKRYEWEACGYQQIFPKGQNSLHLPFYQTNTSQFCPLYARCANGSRGRQELPVQCPGYCGEYVFLYPEHLRMVGRYNSLFALDHRLLEEIREKSKRELDKYLESLGADRIVVNLL